MHSPKINEKPFWPAFYKYLEGIGVDGGEGVIFECTLSLKKCAYVYSTMDVM